MEDGRNYSTPWRSPMGDEYVKLGRLIVANNIGGCGEYYVKEVAKEEYVIACTGDGKNWNYYVAWPLEKKIYQVNQEMETKLNPPR